MSQHISPITLQLSVFIRNYSSHLCKMTEHLFNVAWTVKTPSYDHIFITFCISLAKATVRSDKK